MAELVAFVVAEHIRSLLIGISNKADVLFHVVDEAKAVQLELEDIKERLVEEQQKKELVINEEFRNLLAKVRKMAYDAEDIVDIYYSESQIFSGLSLGLSKIYWDRHTSKELRRLFKEMRDMKNKLMEYSREPSEGSVKSERSTSRSSSEEGDTENTADSQKDEVVDGRENLNENECVGTRGSVSFKGHRQADDDFVVGIENDVESMVKMLTAEGKGKSLQEKEDHIDLLAIVGMGGVGKTTLARNIYNHPKVRRHFKYRAWITLPRGWGISEVVSEISKQLLSNKSLPVVSVSEFVDQVQNLLKMKKCLIVLDSVWDWEFLQELLPKIQIDCSDQRYKTKFLITSRNHHEPSNTPLKWSFHEVQLLNQEHGWDLFNKVTSSDHGKELAKEYRGLAMEMLRKCEGLPLAIVALGKLLKTKDTIQGWERVFSQLMRKQGPNDLYLPVNEILALSYHDLHHTLKPCFLYFGLFPEDFPIKAETLMRMWVAEGYVHGPNNDEESLEVAARQLLQKLIDRTMVQVVKRTYSGKVKTLRVLSMMRDLCIMESQELGFLTVSSSESDRRMVKNSRRAAVNLRKSSTLPIENSRLRSLFLHDHEGNGKHGDIINGTKTYDSMRSLNHTVILDLTLVFEKLKLLRVLDINGIKTSDGVMPKEIGNLIHLRYLRIRSTNICELPKSIGKLQKLLTLDYWNVFVDNDGIRLPNVLYKLTNLKNLYLPLEMSNTKENFKLHTMKDLKALWGIRGGNWMLKEMKILSCKIKKLCIQGISSPKQIISLFKCPVITENDNLYSLALDWYGFSLDGKYIEALGWKKNLKKLKLMGQVSEQSNPSKFPCNLGKLELYYAQLHHSESLQALGELRYLKFLRLAKNSFTGSEWKISANKAFPQLEDLKLSNLKNLKTWEMEKGAMPCLKKLSIVSCTNLKQMPEEFMSIRKLRLKIERMPTDFKSKLGKFKDFNANSADAEYFNIVPLMDNTGSWRSYLLGSINVISIIFVYSVYMLAMH